MRTLAGFIFAATLYAQAPSGATGAPGATGTTGATGATGATGTSTANDVKNAIYCPDTGIANAIACVTSTTFPAAYATGQMIVVRMNATNNSTTVNININALGNTPVYGPSSSLAASDLQSGLIYVMVYDAALPGFRVVGGVLYTGGTLSLAGIIKDPNVGNTFRINVADGQARLTNNAGTGWDKLILGPATTSGIALDVTAGAAPLVAIQDGAGGVTARFGAPGMTSTGTKFTISGCSAGTTVGGATAGQFASGTTGACTVVITMGGATGYTAPNGWACRANDLTTSANLISQSATSTTTCTVTGTTVSGDLITFSATAY